MSMSHPPICPSCQLWQVTLTLTYYWSCDPPAIHRPISTILRKPFFKGSFFKGSFFEGILI